LKKGAHQKLRQLAEFLEHLKRGPHGELTRQRHHLFRRSTQKGPPLPQTICPSFPIINVTHHSTGSTVTQNLTAPHADQSDLRLAKQPESQARESELFATPDEALARAEQLQTEAGGHDMARIDVHDFRHKPAQ
jgi:hypothetical protein